MPNKPVRQSAKYREQQYRKRMAAQAHAAAGLEDAERMTPESDTTRLDGMPVPEATTVRFVPAGTATATAAPPRAGAAASRTATLPPRPAAVPRRPSTMPVPSAVRTARGRIAAQIQQLNLEDEMEFIRSDIRRLLILAAASFVVLFALAFVIH